MIDRAMLGVDRVDPFHRFPVRLGSPEVVNNVDLPHYQNAVLIDHFTGRSRGLSTSLRRGSAAVISAGPMIGTVLHLLLAIPFGFAN